MKIIQYIIFTIVVPCTIGIYIPLIINGYLPLKLNIGILRYIGLLFIFIGCVFYLLSSFSFLINIGTPAIWFAKLFAPLIGKEPDVLVKSYLYSFSRNPMYLGVFLFIFGSAIFKDSFTIFIYFCLIVLFFNLVIIYIEEPHLKKKYGDEYLSYINNVPRWFKFF
jgi:protein-S-isoprenylcysteine O-methyltransferase Ste14